MRRLRVWFSAFAAALLPWILAGCPEWFEKPEPPERTAPKPEPPQIACQPNCAGAYLREANLADASLANIDLSDAYLDGANLRGADLRNAVLVDATLRGADLSGAHVADADLTDADLSGATLRGANLTRATVRGAILVGAELTGADLTGADLHGANLEGADLTAVQGCDVSRRLPRCRAEDGSHEHLASGAAFEAFLRDGTMDSFTAGAVEAVEAAIPEEERQAFVAELYRIDLRGSMSALMANRSFRRLLEITAPYYDARYGSEGRMQRASGAAADSEPYDVEQRFRERMASWLRRWLGVAEEKVERVLDSVFGKAIGARTVVSVCKRTIPFSGWKCAVAVGAYIGWNIQGNKVEPPEELQNEAEFRNKRPGELVNHLVDRVAPCCEQNTALDNLKPFFEKGVKNAFLRRVLDMTFEVNKRVDLNLPAAKSGDLPLTYRLAPEVPGLKFFQGPQGGVHGGVLVGTPTARAGGGVYQMTYRVTDVEGDKDEFLFAIMVNEDAGNEESLAFQIAVGSQSYTVGMEIDVLPLPEATGGVGTLTYRLQPDILGLTFDANARTLSGTPTTANSYRMTYTATDANDATAVLHFVITVEPSSSRLRFTSSVDDQVWEVGVPRRTADSWLQLPEGTGGVPRDGSAPYRYSLAPDVPGMEFSEYFRVLSGTPTKVGVYQMIYAVTDADGAKYELNFTITVVGDDEPPPPPPPDTGDECNWESVPTGTWFLNRDHLGSCGAHGFTAVKWGNICHELDSDNRAALNEVRSVFSAAGFRLSSQANCRPPSGVCRHISEHNAEVVSTEFDNFWTPEELPEKCEESGGTYLGDWLQFAPN